MKVLNDFLKKMKRPLMKELVEKRSSSIESVLGQEYGISFSNDDRFLRSTEFRRRPPEVLFNAVQELKSGHQNPQFMSDAFSVAHGLMDTTNEINSLQRGGDAEFRVAQAILLQLVANFLGANAVTPGRYHLDEHRFIFVVSCGLHFLAIPIYLGETIEVSEPREYLIFPKPNTDRYRSTITVTSVNSGAAGSEFLCEGAHIIISCVHPHIDMAAGSASPAFAAQLLQWFIAAPSAEDVQRYLAAAQQKRPVIFLRRNLGLTRPELPFHESSNVVFLSSPDDVHQVLELADQIPCGLSRHFLDFQTGMVPFTFPPAIDDWDQRMQNNVMQTGLPFLDQEEAASYFFEKLEEVELDLSELEENVIQEVSVVDEDDLIANAKPRFASGEFASCRIVRYWVSLPRFFQIVSHVFLVWCVFSTS